jgi:cell division septum initiation protein DivIVA
MMVLPTWMMALLLATSTGAFLLPAQHHQRLLGVRHDALTEFMDWVHEERTQAVAETELKYKAQIDELQKRVAEYENGYFMDEKKNDSVPRIVAPTNSFQPPATNKGLTEKVDSYRNFLSEYIVKTQIEKVNAVAIAEQRIRDEYEAILAAKNEEK